MSLPSPRKNDTLTAHWLICFAMLTLLAVYNLLCHFWGAELRQPLTESERVLIRTVLYIIAIALFPMTKLMRHILLRLNQTMPGEKTAAQRYLLTIVVTQSMIEVVTLFGPIMFLLGDDFNTLYIFTLLGALGIYLHRPQQREWDSIAEAIAAKTDRSHPVHDS
jgi:hypothetical protein